jgi:hypothetical protein
MTEKVLFRDGEVVVGTYDAGFYCGRIRTGKKGKSAGVEVIADQAWFMGGPRGLRQALEEAAGRIVGEEGRRTVGGYLKRFEELATKMDEVAGRFIRG